MIIKASDLKINDKIKAKADWNFCGWAYIKGKVIFDKEAMCFCIDGEIEGNTDGRRRCFPLYKCWDFERIEKDK